MIRARAMKFVVIGSECEMDIGDAKDCLAEESVLFEKVDEKNTSQFICGARLFHGHKFDK
jgi:hypothetical protein